MDNELELIAQHYRTGERWMSNLANRYKVSLEQIVNEIDRRTR